MSDFDIMTGDTSPPMAARLEDGAGVAANLTDATVRFVMSAIRGTGAPVVVGAAVIDIPVDPPPDIPNVHYVWQVGDTAVPGGYFASFEVTYHDGEIETFPNDHHLSVAIHGELREEGS